MNNLHFSTPRDIIEYLKEMFLKADNVDEFASDFYEFAFQDIDSILKDRKQNEGLIPFFTSLTEAKERLDPKLLCEGFNIIITPSKKKPVIYTIKNGKFVKTEGTLKRI